MRHNWSKITAPDLKVLLRGSESEHIYFRCHTCDLIGWDCDGNGIRLSGYNPEWVIKFVCSEIGCGSRLVIPEETPGLLEDVCNVMLAARVIES